MLIAGEILAVVQMIERHAIPNFSKVVKMPGHFWICIDFRRAKWSKVANFGCEQPRP